MTEPESFSVKTAAGEKYEIQATAVSCGSDWTIAVCGGTLHHIGAVAVGYPGEKEAAADTFLFPGHRDDIVASMFAKKISGALGCRTTVSAGIHIDHASREELRILLENSEKCCEELLRKLSACRPR